MSVCCHFGSPQYFHLNKAIWSLSFSLFFSQCQICNFQGFKRELCLVSRHHDTGFLCDPVELPVFQQKEGPTQQGGFRRLTLQQIPAPQAEPCAYCHSQSTPQESTKTCLHLGLAGWWWELDALFFSVFLKMPSFTDAWAKLVTSQFPVLYFKNAMFWSYLIMWHILLSKNDTLLWHFTTYIST